MIKIINKLNSRLVKTTIIIFSIVLLVIIVFKTKIIVFTVINSDKMLPAFRANELLLGSSLIKPTYGRAVLYIANNKAIGKHINNLFLSRLVGFEGDTIELNDGYVLRNGYIADKPNQLIFKYFVNKRYIYDLKILNNLHLAPIIRNDTLILSLSSHEFKTLSYNILLHKVIFYGTDSMYIINNKRYAGNTIFFPKQIVIPKGYCFVIGDNRGEHFLPTKNYLIPVDDIIATVVF